MTLRLSAPNFPLSDTTHLCLFGEHFVFIELKSGKWKSVFKRNPEPVLDGSLVADSSLVAELL